MVESVEFPDFDDDELEEMMQKTEAKLFTNSQNSSFGGKPQDLDKSLQHYFGFDSFRADQKKACEAIIEGRDVAVFWATGKGKSLCFQLPALHSNKTVIVVSPLISLMQDQVHKLNATVGEGCKDIAVFLGSSQTDHFAEQRALNGDFRLMYVTPEKLLSANFIDKLNTFHETEKDGKILMLAVDEAHCICEWGQDFRADYLKLNQFRRNLKNVPIMALTATADKKQRDEICKNLSLKEPYITWSTCDRPNLDLSVTVKEAGKGAGVILNPLIEKLQASRGSTIVYVPTRNDCETICSLLENRLSKDNIRVAMYHGGMSTYERDDTHMHFLDGSVTVVVATIAFGMGIDKPDVRRVVHYGPPKSFESFYQQIGRAGRDGFQAECNLIFSNSDFQRYYTDFYLGSLPILARKAAEHSIDSLQKYARDSITCRRQSIIEYFGEKAIPNCGRCDNCMNRKKYADDQVRDFSQEAKIVIKAVDAVNGGHGITKLLQIVSGTFVPKKGPMPLSLSKAMGDIKEMRKVLSVHRSNAFFKEMFAVLATSGYLKTERRSITLPGGYQNVYEAYYLSALGNSTLQSMANGTSISIKLPIPASIRKLEQQQKEDVDKRSSELVSAGVDLAYIPNDELIKGFGPILSAHQHWIRVLNNYRQKDPQKARHLDDLLKRILSWRDSSARKLKVAPASVLSPHLARQVAYSQPSAPEAIRALGIRIAGADELCQLILNWKDENTRNCAGEDEISNKLCASNVMVVPQGIWKPKEKWVHSVYKPRGKAKLCPLWEVSYKRFHENNEHLQSIAATQHSGKPVKVATVIGHMMTALCHGYPIDLNRLLNEGDVLVPTQEDWEKLKVASIAINFNENEISTNIRKDFIRAILGTEVVDVDPLLKSEAQKQLESRWYGFINIFVNFQRIKVPIAFKNTDEANQHPTKRPRAN